MSGLKYLKINFDKNGLIQNIKGVIKAYKKNLIGTNLKIKVIKLQYIAGHQRKRKTSAEKRTNTG